MSQHADLDALIAKVEGAKEGDEVLDLAIFLALHPDDETVAKWAGTFAAMDDAALVHWASRFLDLPHYTSSLDAIVKLVEAKLPGWSWQIRDQKESSFPRHIGANAWLITPADGRRMGDAVASAPTPALALCLALLLALKAQEEGKP